MKRLVVHRRADDDLDDAADYYLSEQGLDLAEQFLAAARRTIETVGRSPGLGSASFAATLDVPNLRARSIDGVPYIVFFLALDDSVRIIRVLHRSRDVVNVLGSPAGSQPDP